MEPDTEQQRTRPWAVEVAMAVAGGAFQACLPVHRWPRGARWAMHGGMGAATAAGTALLLRLPTSEPGSSPSPTDDEPVSIRATAAVAVSVGLAMAAVSRGGEAADAWTERRLTARGVRRPRLWIGVAAGALTFAMSVVDRRSPNEAEAQIEPGSVGGGGEPGAGG